IRCRRTVRVERVSSMSCRQYESSLRDAAIRVLRSKSLSFGRRAPDRMRQMQRAHVAVPLAIALTAGQIGEPAAAAVSAYRAALDRLEHRGSGATVVVVFDRALALNAPLTQPPREEEAIEQPAPAAFASLRS